MNINKNCFLAPLALLMVGSWSVSMAQTCNSPTTITSNQAINAANNCTTGVGTGDGTIGTVCGSNDVTGGVHVYTWTHGSGATGGNITVTPTAPYNAAIFVASGADCATAAGAVSCDGGLSDNSGQTAESIDLTAVNVANNTYFLFVASTAAGTAKCGQYNMTVGTLPVKLQSFSIN